MIFTKQTSFFLLILTISIAFSGSVIPHVYASNHPTAAITYSSLGPYQINQTITITATFSEAMASTPLPKIAITGTNTVSATNMILTSTTVYTYVHTVGYGHGNSSVVMSVGKDGAGNVVIATPTSGATFAIVNDHEPVYPPYIHDEILLVLNSDKEFILDVNDNKITNISTNVGDVINITISVGDDAEVEQISPITFVTNFAKKPSDMNNYFATNTLNSQTGLSVYELNQNTVDQNYSYGEILTWNDSTIIKQ